MAASDHLSKGQFNEVPNKDNFFHVSPMTNRDRIAAEGLDPKEATVQGSGRYVGTSTKPKPPKKVVWFVTHRNAIEDTYTSGKFAKADIWHSTDIGNYRDEEEEGGPRAVSTRSKVAPSKLKRVGHIDEKGKVNWFPA